MTVYLLRQNDTVLGVYGTVARAHAAAVDVMRADPGLTWQTRAATPNRPHNWVGTPGLVGGSSCYLSVEGREVR